MFTKRQARIAELTLVAYSYCFWHILGFLPLAWSLSPTTKKTFVIVGGTGKIGTAVAAHLLSSSSRQSSCTEVVLVGRGSKEVGQRAIQQVQAMTQQQQPDTGTNVLSFQYVADIWDPDAVSTLTNMFSSLQATCVIHTAGPYAERSPTVLDAAIAASVPAYVDVSDPVPYLKASLERYNAAQASGTTALCAAGAFPGMSNVLAMEAADELSEGPIKDVRFNYFTKGLGGSGTINLYITNIGFGDPMIQHDSGQRKSIEGLSGKLLGTVDFFIKESSSLPPEKQSDNEQAKRRVGTQQVFAWPFPEAATVASQLSIEGSSSAAMGTAPDVWNVMLGLLVNVIPQDWWRSRRFSKFMADFSQPLVLLTDAFMKQQESGTNGAGEYAGETHAMRIDVVGGKAQQPEMISIVQAHDSFRQCVGQSCAEFALDLLENPSPGVFLPEQRYRSRKDRLAIVHKLTSTPGTFCYTGPANVQRANQKLPVYPTRIKETVAAALKQL